MEPPDIAQAPRTARAAAAALPGADRGAFLHAVQALSARHQPLVVLAADLADFTAFNHRHGLAAGDAALALTAQRCAALAGQTQAAGGQALWGRIGADEFALALVPPPAQRHNGAALAWLDRAARGAHAALAAPGELGGQPWAPEVALGSARLDGDGDVAQALLHAIVARRQAGAPGAASWEAQQGERSLVAALHQAIADDQIEIALQPKVRLADGRLAGLEALARWRQADGQPVPPAVFVPLAERHGLVCALGERVLHRTLATVAAWQRQGCAVPPVAVNFAAPQFHQADFVARIGDALGRHGLAPERLEIELTESMLLSDLEVALPRMHALRALGVSLAIDDFGIGYSSLAYVRHYPVQRLKIDRSFVRGLVEDDRAAAIVELMLQLGRRLGLVCVAEGIESPAQLARLRELGCDEGQGFLLARPQPPEDCAPWLAPATPWLMASRGEGPLTLAQQRLRESWC